MALLNPIAINQLTKYNQLAKFTKTKTKLVVVDQALVHNSAEILLVDTPKNKRLRWKAYISPMLRLYHRRKQHWIDKKACQQLLRLDDSSLKDIGINRADIIWAVRKQSPRISASAELEKIARENRLGTLTNKCT